MKMQIVNSAKLSCHDLQILSKLQHTISQGVQYLYFCIADLQCVSFISFIIL